MTSIRKIAQIGALTVAFGMAGLVAAAPASAVTFGGNINNGDTVDVLATGYNFNAQFEDGDAADTFTFTFENNSDQLAAVTLTTATINQQGGNAFFTDGVDTTFGSFSRSTAQGAFDAFQFTVLIDALSSETLTFDFGDVEINTSGLTTDIDFILSASPVPVPAALPLFASALLGLGLLGRRRRG